MKKTRGLTPWTIEQVIDFSDWHESVINEYGAAVTIKGQVYDVQGDLRQDRIKFLGSIPVLNN